MNKYFLGLLLTIFCFTSCKNINNHSVKITANYLSWGKGYSFIFIANRQGNIEIQDLVKVSNNNSDSIFFKNNSLCNKLFSNIDNIYNIEEIVVGIDDYENHLIIEYKNKKCIIEFKNNNYEAYNVGYNNTQLASVIKEIIGYSLLALENRL